MDEITLSSKIGKSGNLDVGMDTLSPYLLNFQIYLETEERRSAGTVRGYLADVRQLLVFLRENSSQEPFTWEAIDARDLRDFLAQVQPAPHRAHRLLASWSKFWTFLKEVEWLEVSHPPSQLKRPRLPKRLPRYLETEEVKSLLIAAYDDVNPARGLRNWALLAFLYGSGLRVSEALMLTFDRIHLQDGLPQSVTVIGKGDRERLVPLSPTAQRALAQWLKVRHIGGHPTSRFVWSYLSGQQRGEPFRINTINAAVKVAAARAGLDPVRVSPHKLRHSFATALVEQGRSLHEIGAILGHENPSTTAIYGQLKRAQLQSVVASLPDPR